MINWTKSKECFSVHEIGCKPPTQPKFWGQLGQIFWDRSAPHSHQLMVNGWGKVLESHCKRTVLWPCYLVQERWTRKEEQFGCELITHGYCITFLFGSILILLDIVDTDLASSKSIDNTPWFERWANSLHLCLFMSRIREKEKAKAVDSLLVKPWIKNENRFGKHLQVEWLDQTLVWEWSCVVG